MPRCRRLHLDELLSTAEAAALAGVAVRTWSAWVSRGRAPAPAARLGEAPGWRREDVEQWMARRPRAGRA
jgi:excisionase family DNA binding protein